MSYGQRASCQDQTAVRVRDRAEIERALGTVATHAAFDVYRRSASRREMPASRAGRTAVASLSSAAKANISARSKRPKGHLDPGAPGVNRRGTDRQSHSRQAT